MYFLAQRTSWKRSQQHKKLKLAAIGENQVNLKLLLLTLVFCLLNCSSPAALAQAKDMDTAMDQLMTTRSGNSDFMDHWFKFYASGNIKEADKTWASILKQCADREEIGDFTENINERCWFAESNNRNKVDAEQAYKHLLATTERMLGKDHRFVADLYTFLAVYAEARHDFKKAKSYRLLDLKLHEKALGPNNHQVIEANQEIGHLLLSTKEYNEAEPYLKKALVMSKKQGLKRTFQRAKADYLKLLYATNRGAEARHLMAKHKTL